MISLQLLDAWGSAWLGTMARALIEGSVLLIAVAAVWLPFRRRISAQFAHGLFCLVLLKLVVPVPVPLALSPLASWWTMPGAGLASVASPAPPAAAEITPARAPTTGDLATSPGEASAATPPVVIARPSRAAVPAPRPGPSVAATLMVAWALVASFLVARLLLATLATRRLLAAAEPLRPGWVPIDLDALRRAAGLRRPIRWGILPRLHSPAVGGLFRASVVLPPDLCDELTPKQLAWVLLHELAHVRRGDLWIVMGQRLAQAIFFFHPAVYLANRIIDELREYACDDEALAVGTASRRDCGEGFLAVVELAVERSAVPAPALGLFESRMLIRRRLVRILDARREIHSRLSPRAAILLAATASGLLLAPTGWARGIAARWRPGPATPDSRVDGPVGFGWPLGGAGLDAVEPTTYRPSATWHRAAARSEHGAARAVPMAMACSPDGRTLAVAGDDGLVMLRDLSTGREIGRLEGHGDAVSCLAYSPDGRTLATGSFDRTVKLWNPSTGRERATLTGHSNWVFALAFAPDGRTLASAGHDRTVKLWDPSTGREVAAIEGHASSVRALAFAPGGRMLATGGADRLVMLWDLDRPDRPIRLRGHRGAVRALAFSPDGRALASGGEDGEVRLWDPSTGRERASLSGHTDMVTCLAFSGGGILATGSLDTTVKLWDAATWRERASLQGHRDGVSAVAFAAGARRMATGGFDGSVRLWEPAAPVFSPSACLSYPGRASGLTFASDGRTLRAVGELGVARWDALAGSSAPIGDALHFDAAAIAATPDGALYAVGTPDGAVLLFDAASDRPIATLRGRAVAITAMAASPDSQWIAAGNRDGTVGLWDLRARRLAATIAAPGGAIAAVAFSPDAQTMAVAAGGTGLGDASAFVTLWDIATRQRHGAPIPMERGAAMLAFAPDGRALATADLGGVVRFWGVDDGRPLGALSFDGCRTIAFAPDGRSLAASRDDGDVVLWDVRDGRPFGLLKGHRGRVTQVVFAPDRRRIATASDDRTVKIWSLATRRRTARATLAGDSAPVWSVAFAPDGRTLAIGDGPIDAPGTVAFWDVASRKVVATMDDHEQGVAAVAYSPDGRTLATGGWDGTIRIRDVRARETRHVIEGLNGVCHLSFSPDGRLLASAGEGNIVTLWDVATGTEEARLTGFAWPVRCVAFSPDGRLVATGGGAVDNRPGAGGEVKFWSVADASLVRSLEGPTRAALALAFSPDGGRLAAGGLDESIRVWDVATGRPGLVMGGLGSCVQSLAFSPDGRTLAWSGRVDGLVAIHDATTGAERIRLVGHASVVRSIAFAPGGRSLATGGADRTVKLWDLAGDDRSDRGQELPQTGETVMPSPGL